jgi:hypothetical protein
VDGDRKGCVALISTTENAGRLVLGSCFLIHIPSALGRD